MTDSGLIVLRALRDGEARTIAQIATSTGRCSRVTRGALQGCFVVDLVTRQPPDRQQPELFQITALGLRELNP